MSWQDSAGWRWKQDNGEYAAGGWQWLDGNHDALESNKAIVAAIRNGLKKENIPEDAIALIEDTSHETAREFMRMNGYLDVLRAHTASAERMIFRSSIQQLPIRSQLNLQTQTEHRSAK